MRRILAVLGAVLGSTLVLTPMAQAKPKGDSIISYITPSVPGPVQFNGNPDTTITINAFQKKNKANASGTFSGKFLIGGFDATVNFINVSGTEACAAATVTSSTIGGVAPGAGAILSVQDGSPDLTQISFLPDNPGSCSFIITSPSAITSGDIVLTDTIVP